MHNYVRAYAKKNNHWDLVSIESDTLNVIINSYQNVRVITTFDVETAERGIDFKRNRTALSMADKALTLQQWLATLAKDAIVTDNTFVSFNDVQCVKHWNLFDLPVKVEGSNAKYGKGQPLPVGMKTDLMITSDVDEVLELSTKNIAKNMLIAINGRVCKMSMIDGNAYAIDAYNKVENGSNVLSAIDFTDVGGLTQVDITDDMIEVFVQSTIDLSLNRQRVTIDIPVALPGTTPILIMDGHLHVLDGSYRRLGATKLLVNVDLVLAMKRASRHKQYNHDYVNSANVREEGISGSSFDVKKYMAQTDTFFAFVHTEDLCTFKEPLTATQTYGGYEHHRAPKGIIVNERFEYMPHIYEEVSATHISISVGNNIKNQNFYDTFKFDHKRPFGDSAYSRQKREYQKAYAFEMYVF